ncbi:MAG TPA: tripartite tricarboxylate transporter substrate-binding protein, partial [Xanthobacteraceae bacterium]|nr:tripartite tricarboxylate transporter substrate-binding protein [Xanthobacteraceae bacterium]
GIFAPAGTPQPIIDKLNQAIVAVESKPDFQQKFLISRGLTPVMESAEQFAKELPADRAEGRAVVKASGLYPDVK